MYMSIKNSHAARELLAAYNANTLFSKKLGGAIATDDAYAVQFDLLTLREAAGEALAGEAGDLLYHLLVVLVARGVTLDQVMELLAARASTSGLVEKKARDA